MMDLRAPIHDTNDGNNEKSPYNHDESYERILYQNLCRMHVASEMMELGSESRFTGLVLFHRYARRFYCLLQQNQQPLQREQQQNQTTSLQQSAQEMDKIKNHLGPVAAACLFLGCKMEEEPRRIRDVINISHLLNFSSWVEEDPTDFTETLQQQQTLKKAKENNKPIHIVESPHPPPLDESYWAAKERMVSMEQHVLRMIRFDTTVCHPHRCVLTIMDTLGFGTGKGNGNRKANGDHQTITKSSLLDSDQSERVIFGAWKILNEAVLDPKGMALHCPVIALSCAAISLEAEGGVGSDDVINDGKPVATLPEFWWRALDVSTNEVNAAREALRKVLQ